MILKDKINLIFKTAAKSKGKALVNYFHHWSDLKSRPDAKRAQLISAQIEPTTRCNLRCKMCQHSFDQMQKNQLTLEQFKRILNQMPFLANLTLQGLGEPLLNAEIFEMIKEAKMRGIRIGFTTNGTLLSEEMAGKIISSGLDWMYISLDAIEKSVYEKIRTGANYDVVIKNVRNFFKLKNNRNPDTNFWSLIMKDNFSQLPDVVKFAKEVGAKRVVMQNIHNWGHSEFNADISAMRHGAPEEISKLADQIRKMKTGVSVEINYLDPQGEKCDWPWRSSYITCDGFITPCCMNGSDPQIVNFGNIFKKDLMEILNNENYKDFRREIKSKLPPKICHSCPAYHKQKTIRV